MTDETKKKVEKIMKYCQTQADIYNNYQLSSKVIINGIYGSFGFSGFYFYNPVIAESVTKQGKDAILNAERLMNLWAKKVWVKDEKTHRMMGVKIKQNADIQQDITVYIDTDSCVSSTFINISDDIIMINNIPYHKDDIIKVLRDGKELSINASDIQESDLIWVD